MCTDFFTDVILSCFLPMKLTSEAHEALSPFFQWDGVLSTIICDNAKEMIIGEFMCHLRQTKPFTQWLNAAKREIKELKKGSSRKLKSGILRRLCDDPLELKSYI